MFLPPTRSNGGEKHTIGAAVCGAAGSAGGGVLTPGEQVTPLTSRLLARDERMTPKDASIALAKVQESFWESKAGQQHLQKRTERTFPEFIAKVPGKVLTEAGLRRHYKEPEPVKPIQQLKPRRHE